MNLNFKSLLLAGFVLLLLFITVDAAMAIDGIDLGDNDTTPDDNINRPRGIMKPEEDLSDEDRNYFDSIVGRINNTTFFINYSTIGREITYTSSVYGAVYFGFWALEVDRYFGQKVTAYDNFTVGHVTWPNPGEQLRLEERFHVCVNNTRILLFKDGESSQWQDASRYRSRSGSDICVPGAFTNIYEFPNLTHNTERFLFFEEHPSPYIWWQGLGQGGGGNGLPVCDVGSAQISVNVTELNITNDFLMRGKWTCDEAGGTGLNMEWRTNQSGIWKVIPQNNNSNPLDCKGVSCIQTSPARDTWFNRTIRCDKEKFVYVRIWVEFEDGGGNTEEANSAIKTVDCQVGELPSPNVTISGPTETVVVYVEANQTTDQQVNFTITNSDTCYYNINGGDWNNINCGLTNLNFSFGVGDWNITILGNTSSENDTDSALFDINKIIKGGGGGGNIGAVFSDDKYSFFLEGYEEIVFQNENKYGFIPVDFDEEIYLLWVEGVGDWNIYLQEQDANITIDVYDVDYFDSSIDGFDGRAFIDLTGIDPGLYYFNVTNPDGNSSILPFINTRVPAYAVFYLDRSNGLFDFSRFVVHFFSVVLIFLVGYLIRERYFAKAVTQ